MNDAIIIPFCFLSTEDFQHSGRVNRIQGKWEWDRNGKREQEQPVVNP